jgi:hypothetical protein
MADFKAQWTALEASLADLVPQPGQTAATLYDKADEYGAEVAVAALESEVLDPGDPGSVRLEIMSEQQRDALVARVDELLTARDVLDTASQSLGAVRVAAGRERILHIGDRAFALDRGGVLARPMDGQGDAFTLDVPHAPQPTPTLTQQARAVEQVEKAQPAPEQSRTRGR